MFAQSARSASCCETYMNRANNSLEKDIKDGYLILFVQGSESDVPKERTGLHEDDPSHGNIRPRSIIFVLIHTPTCACMHAYIHGVSAPFWSSRRGLASPILWCRTHSSAERPPPVWLCTYECMVVHIRVTNGRGADVNMHTLGNCGGRFFSRGNVPERWGA